MLSLEKYFEQMVLDKNDPDYQIEDFWYGLKNSMRNFYQSNGLKLKNIQEWSDKLNEYKKDKKYDLIESSIKNYIATYAIHIMKYDKFNDYTHSSILLKNMKRWKEISNKFHFGETNRNELIYILFEAFNCIKMKLDKNLFPILELFNDIEEMMLNDYAVLIYKSFELKQFKVLETVEKLIGKNKVFESIKTSFEELNLTNKDEQTSYIKLYKKYNEKYNT